MPHAFHTLTSTYQLPHTCIIHTSKLQHSYPLLSTNLPHTYQEHSTYFTHIHTTNFPHTYLPHDNHILSHTSYTLTTNLTHTKFFHNAYIILTTHLTHTYVYESMCWIYKMKVIIMRTGLVHNFLKGGDKWRFNAGTNGVSGREQMTFKGTLRKDPVSIAVYFTIPRSQSSLHGEHWCPRKSANYDYLSMVTKVTSNWT